MSTDQTEQSTGQDNQDSAQPETIPIVGIGASAGGLEALQAFFDHMPPDAGICFVVVTHIKPGHESMLPEILSRNTAMSVIASENGQQLKPNTLVVATDSLLSISDGMIHHRTKDSEPDAFHHPVDYFFRSLANEQGDGAIGIILSGSGSDGTVGCKAIKAAGGMIMIQDPDSAKYGGMPESARANSPVDHILAAEELPKALVAYCQGPFQRGIHQPANTVISDDDIHAILVQLRGQTGHDFTHYKRRTMARRIERRMSVHRIDEPQDYMHYLRENEREKKQLLQELLISVTNFFRDPAAFDALRRRAILPLLNNRDEQESIRVWIPGCATGEEAYSIAILIEEQMHETKQFFDVQIFATDLDERAIEAARSGLYPEGIATDMTGERLTRYFSHEENAYRIHKNIREMIVFASQNLLSDPPFTRMDLIVCRNLLIYLNADAQEQVLATFHYALRPGGLLFLGTSEAMNGSEAYFEMIDSRNKILRRKGDARTIQPTLSVWRGHAGDEKNPAQKEVWPMQTRHLGRVVERLLLNQFAPCSIVVDEQDTVVYLHGQSGAYLEPEQGQPRNNLLDMARDGLRLSLSHTLRAARKDQQETVKRGVRVNTNGGYIQADICVRPLTSPEPLRGLFLVTLGPGGTADQSLNPIPTAEAQPLTEQASGEEEIERELRYARENLQISVEDLETSNEELKTSNEELQSTNEELQSANEELETSREETQSLNEELNTVNAELKAKVDDLTRARDDMQNLLNSMQVAAIFLDRDLHVKRYTSKARDIVRLIDSDIGRPLSDLTSSLKYDGLIEDARQVLETLQTKEMEVRDADDQWFLLRLMPYRAKENVIDGIVITITNIHRAKHAEEEQAYYKNIADTMPTKPHKNNTTE